MKDVRVFLGLALYYRMHIPGFLTLASHMTSLTCQGVDLVWDDACEGDFRTLEAALGCAMVLLILPRKGILC